MKRTALAAFFAMFILGGCVVATSPPGYEVDVAPPLPAVIELQTEPYYYYSGYYYFYDNGYWRYSRSRSGPWTNLPRSHWPKEIRRGRMEEHREREFHHEHED